MNTIMNLLFDKDFLVMAFVGILAFATVLTLGIPYLEGNGLNERLKSVAARREELRAKHHAALNGKRGSLRVELWYPHRPYRFPRITRFTPDPPRWEEIAIARDSPYTNEIGHFLRLVRGESVENDSSVEDSTRDLAILREIRNCAVYLEK